MRFNLGKRKLRKYFVLCCVMVSFVLLTKLITSTDTEVGIIEMNDEPDEHEPPSVFHCEGVEGFPPTVKTSSNWIEVSNSHKEKMIYSAFLYEIGGKRVVRVIGLTSLRQTTAPLWCYLWFDDSTVIVEGAKVVPFTDNHNLIVADAFFTCHITGQRTPKWVSIVDRKCATPISRLPIHNSITRADKSREHTFTLCFSPLWQYDNITHLVSTIETNRAFGAEKFVFYNKSTGTRVNSALQTYIQDGIVDVLPWNINLHFQKCPTCRNEVGRNELHYNGQNSAINDCLYRYRDRSEFLVFLDLDEIIVPKNHKNWFGLMKNLPYAPSYRFRSSFFKLEFPDRSNCPDKVLKYRIEPLQKMYRETYIFPHDIRPKSIIRPEKVDLMGIHQVFVFRDKKSADFMVDPSLAMVNHYRIGWWGDEHPTILDSTIVQFEEQIINNVRARWNVLCNRFKSYCVQNVPVGDP